MAEVAEEGQEAEAPEAQPPEDGQEAQPAEDGQEAEEQSPSGGLDEMQQPTAPVAKPVDKQKAEIRRRQQDAAYLRKHQERLEAATTRCVNKVLLERPADPYSGMLEMLSELTQAGVSFGVVRVLPNPAGTIELEVAARVRGSGMAVHRAIVPKALVARGLAAVRQEAAPEDPEAAPALQVAAQLRAAIGGAFAGCGFLGLSELSTRLDEALPLEPPGAEGLSAGTMLRNIVSSALLEAAGRLKDASAIEAIRAGARLRDLTAAPPLHCRGDLASWPALWPQLLVPVLKGSSPRRRLSIGLGLWASALQEITAIEGAAPVELVDKEAAEARQEAGEREPGDEPDPDEFCPPINSVAILATLAAHVFEKVKAAAAAFGAPVEDPSAKKKADAKAKPKAKAGAKGAPVEEEPPTLETPAMPDGDVEKALECIKGVLEEVMPKYLEAQSAEIDNGHTAEALAGRLQRGSIFLALHADADGAFDEESGGYKLSGPEGAARTHEELLEHFEQLFQAQPLLSVLVGPLSPRDPAFEAGMSALRARLPPSVAIVAEAGGSTEGAVRDLSRSPLGMVAEYERCNEAYLQKLGLYDFDVHPQLFGQVTSYVEASLALPETSRMLVLPKSGGAQETAAMLEPLGAQLRTILLTAYQRSDATDGRHKTDNLTLLQFREGLRRTGFGDADRCAPPIFNLLDTNNKGYISPAALGMLEHVRGPASIQEVDAFRAWLCEWEQQQRRAVLGTGEGTPAGSPIASLWRRLGPRDEDWAFDDFKKAVQKQMKYSAGSKSSAHLLEVFACLDTSSSGFISEEQFMRLNLISANHRLERVCKVRDFLVERFGSVTQAFQALDENRTGALGVEVFAGVMEGQHGYSSKDDIRATFQFVNIHRNHQLAPKDFEVLEELDMFKFFDDVAALEECLVSKHGSLKEAFTAFQEEAGKEVKQKSRATTAMSEHRSISIAAAAARRPKKPDLDPSDFLGGCRLSGFQGVYDPRYVFNFLDPACEGKLGPTDFALLGELSSMETLEATTQRVSTAIDAVKAFALANGDCGEESPWEVLHRRLREATHHDLFA